MKLLIVGPMPPPIGGATVLFKQLIDFLLARTELQLIVANSGRTRSSRMSNLIGAVRCGTQVLANVRNVDVLSLHASVRGVKLFGPVLFALSKVFTVPLIVRVFGGTLHEWHASASWVRKFIFDATVLRAEVLCIESRAGVAYFEQLGNRNVHWYPNSRPRSATSNPKSRNANAGLRFVFLGHVKPTKGVRELIQASKRLAHRQAIVDVYGPLEDGISIQDFSGAPTAYKGEIATTSVNELLRTYDVLVLPSYSEGYPGVVLEAYGAGLAVIATRVGGLTEIVTEETGILVEPRNVDQLVTAMESLIDSRENLQQMQACARKAAEQYDSQRWGERFIEICRKAKGYTKSKTL